MLLHHPAWTVQNCSRHEDILTLHNVRQSPVVLKLVEGFFQHVLRVDLLHTQQVEHHVVGQVEGAV